MGSKRFYWLKLHEHFFDRAVIKYLRKLPNGDTIVLIYLELLCISLQSDGYVYPEGLYQSMDEDIALMLGEEVMTVRLALSALEAAGLITRGSDAADYYCPEFAEMVGSESDSARRVRALRARKKQGSVTMKRLCNADETEGNAPVTAGNTEKDKETEKDTDKDTDSEVRTGSSAYGLYDNVYLTMREMESLKERFPDSYKGKIDNLSVYLQSTGRRYKSHYLTICRWDEKDKKEAAAKPGTGFPDYSRVKEGESY